MASFVIEGGHRLSGDILFMLGEVDEAVTYWQKALEAGSESAELLQKKIKNKKYIEK